MRADVEFSAEIRASVPPPMAVVRDFTAFASRVVVAREDTVRVFVAREVVARELVFTGVCLRSAVLRVADATTRFEFTISAVMSRPGNPATTVAGNNTDSNNICFILTNILPYMTSVEKYGNTTQEKTPYFNGAFLITF